MTPRRVWERARSMEELQDLLLEEPGLFSQRRPSLDTPWEDVPLAFIDVETTGLDVESGDRVVELAVSRIDPGREERRFLEIFDPGREIPEAVQRIHAIRPSQLRTCRGFGAAAGEILEILSGAVWAGHNLNFDVRFLRHEMRRAGKSLSTAWILDTMLLARRWCTLQRYSLESVARQFGCEGRNTHKALDDILTTRAILPPLLSLISPAPCTLGDVLTAMVPEKRSAP